MEISLLEHRDFVFGSVDIVQCANGLAIRRMTPELFNIYGYSESADIRAKCPSDVRIRFKTDSKTLGVKLCYGRAARKLYSLDVAVDGQKAVILLPEEEGGPLDATTDLPGNGIHSVEINLPNLIESEIISLRVDDGSKLEPPNPYQGKLVVVGDSIVQGMTCSHPSDSTFARFSRLTGMDVHNLAVGGAVMDPAPLAASRALGGTEVVVAFGINDFSTSKPMAKFSSQTREVCELLQSDPRHPFIVVPIPYPGENGPNKENLTSDDYREVIRKTAAEFPRITVIDGMQFFPMEEPLYVDNCHPNNLGMAVYAHVLASMIHLKK
ncbi:MAG: hypothetical protein J6X55_04010 [Victivallales bacterium]|nr:hypothetical protein [Victivallales bacterium]